MSIAQEERIIGDKIKELREARGMSREQLAVDSGLSYNTIVKLEQGRGLPRIDTLRDIAAVFELSVKDLLSDALLPAAA